MWKKVKEQQQKVEEIDKQSGEKYKEIEKEKDLEKENKLQREKLKNAINNGEIKLSFAVNPFSVKEIVFSKSIKQTLGVGLQTLREMKIDRQLSYNEQVRQRGYCYYSDFLETLVIKRKDNTDVFLSTRREIEILFFNNIPYFLENCFNVLKKLYKLERQKLLKLLNCFNIKITAIQNKIYITMCGIKMSNCQAEILLTTTSFFETINDVFYGLLEQKTQDMRGCVLDTNDKKEKINNSELLELYYIGKKVVQKNKAKWSVYVDKYLKMIESYFIIYDQGEEEQNE